MINYWQSLPLPASSRTKFGQTGNVWETKQSPDLFLPGLIQIRHYMHVQRLSAHLKIRIKSRSSVATLSVPEDTTLDLTVTGKQDCPPIWLLPDTCYLRELTSLTPETVEP